MAKRNRKTLKNFFKKGQMPSEENFSDLIDSMVNIVDEGFNKSINEGLEISPVGESSKLITFYQDIEDKNPIWSCETQKDKNNLSINNKKGEKVFVLNEEGNVGVNSENPKTELDVNGVISYKGKTGTYKNGYVPADGKWHKIISNLDGCQAFEVMAGVGKKKTGKYALMHAFALSTFNSKNQIKYHQSFFKTLCNTIKLRWTGSMHNYALEMKTRSDFGQDIYVKFSVSQLWFDTFMDECFKPKTEGNQ